MWSAQRDLHPFRSLTAYPDLYLVLPLRATTCTDDRLRTADSAVSLWANQNCSTQNPNRTSAIIGVGRIDRNNEPDINIVYAIKHNNVKNFC
jgi:hypothetical protein